MNILPRFALLLVLAGLPSLLPATPVFHSSGIYNHLEDFAAASDLTGWSVDRYAPAAFEAASPGLFSGESVLKIGIDGAAASTRPPGWDGNFYNTHGQKLAVPEGTVAAKASQYVAADWLTSHRRSDFWGVVADASSVVTFYPIIGFGNTEGNNPVIRCYDINAGVWQIIDAAPVAGWYDYEILVEAAVVKYKVNGAVVASFPMATPGALKDIIL